MLPRATRARVSENILLKEESLACRRTSLGSMLVPVHFREKGSNC